jgi:hypothetical protein
MSAETPDHAAKDDRPVVSSHRVDVIVSLLLLGLAGLLGWDSWRTGASWAPDGPEAGYFPFYLAVLLAAASMYGLVRAVTARGIARDTFVTREQFGRVLAMFVPTLAFVILTQFLGLYVASFLLVAGFMGWIGEIAWWKSVLAAFLFTAVMFGTFEVAFNVIMPKGPLEAAFGY